MGIKRKIKNSYEGLSVPEKERVLPGAALEAPADVRRSTSKRSYFRPALAAMLVICVLAAGVIGAFALRRDVTEGVADNASRSETNASYNDGVIGGNTESGTESGAKHGSKDDVIEIVPGDLSYSDGTIGGREHSGTEWAEESPTGVYDPEIGYVVPSGTGKTYYHTADGKTYYETGYPADAPGCEEIPGFDEQFRAGTLTAGEWRDVRKISEWLKKFAEEDSWMQYSERRGLFAYNVIEVCVKNGDSSVYGAKAELVSRSGDVIFAAVTDIDGRAYLVYPEKEKQSLAAVRACGKTVEVTSADCGKCVEIETDSASAEIKELDFMLMVDTTGSMGDELEYLKIELANVISRIAENGQALSIRVSVNFYRDEGDDYIVKYFDFRSDIEECLKQIKAQRSEGGGDYPEAVHTALENAVNGHAWRENAVKLCFLVLDAPPHTEDEIQSINSQIVKTLTDAAAKGVRIIPVASSGIDKETEVQLRSYAVMTGGTYIFLTDDSGYGNSHIEASVGEYDVEPLNECIIRVSCEYCGLGYTAPEKPETSEESPVIVDGQ